MEISKAMEISMGINFGYCMEFSMAHGNFHGGPYHKFQDPGNFHGVGKFPWGSLLRLRRAVSQGLLKVNIFFATFPYLLTNQLTWVGARDTCVSKKLKSDFRGKWMDLDKGYLISWEYLWHDVLFPSVINPAFGRGLKFESEWKCQTDCHWTLELESWQTITPDRVLH